MFNPARNTNEPLTQEFVVDTTADAVFDRLTVADCEMIEAESMDMPISGDVIAVIGKMA